MPSAKRKILVVGQVPPPWGGQAVMIKKLMDANLRWIDLQLVPMAFSRDMNEIGRFRPKKLLRLALLIVRVWQARFRKHCDVLYYPPGGESVTAIARDIVVLLSCRIIFKRVIFHVHAGGFAEIALASRLPIRLLARFAYSKPDLVIQLTEKSPSDGALINAKRIVNVPNGLADDGSRYTDTFRDERSSRPIKLLFVGVVSPSKGVMVLLRACAQLKADGADFLLRVMGGFYSHEFQVECETFIDDHGLHQYVEFLGVLTGNDKWEIYCSSDILCFPSFFESENQSLVILEAMQFGLPSVASDWRSIPTMVEDGETGYLVPVKDSVALAERIGFLIDHPGARVEMGSRARAVFLERYTDAIWESRMQAVLGEV
jgi:glycosyltransferase involved in cell wall biosynthesis